MQRTTAISGCKMFHNKTLPNTAQDTFSNETRNWSRGFESASSAAFARHRTSDASIERFKLQTSENATKDLLEHHSPGSHQHEGPTQKNDLGCHSSQPCPALPCFYPLLTDENDTDRQDRTNPMNTSENAHHVPARDTIHTDRSIEDPQTT